jgi:multicomponent Na+:H+ antiporter subunit D
LIQAALERGQWWLVFLILLSSLLAVVYVWRFVEAAYLREPPADSTDAIKSRWSMLLPAALLAAATVYFGLDTSLTLGSASQAAAMLMSAPR